MEQVITEIVCDLCFKIDDRRTTEIAFSDAIKIGEIEGKLDLCADHADGTRSLNELISIIEAYGNPVIKRKPIKKATATSAEEVPDVACPMCGTPMATRKILRGHAKRQHDITLKELDHWASEHGLAKTRAGGYVERVGKRHHEPAPCDHCDVIAGSGAGLRAHKDSAHPGWQDRKPQVNGRVPVMA